MVILLVLLLTYLYRTWNNLKCVMFHFICPREDANRSILLLCLYLHPKSNCYIRVISCSAFMQKKMHPFVGCTVFQITEKSIWIWFCNQGCILFEVLKPETRQSLVICRDLRIAESQNCLGGKEPLEIISSIQTLPGSSRVISSRFSRTTSSQVLNIFSDGGCWLLYDDCQFRKFNLYLLIETE